MTEAESLLWEKLKGKKLLNLRFRRQRPIGQFITDFYCHSAKLVIEVDGEIHKNTEVYEYDKNRTFELNKFGLEVIRFTNNDVLNNIENVIKDIANTYKNRLHLPD